MNPEINVKLTGLTATTGMKRVVENLLAASELSMPDGNTK
jgi:hypothetical protein